MSKKPIDLTPEQVQEFYKQEHNKYLNKFNPTWANVKATIDMWVVSEVLGNKLIEAMPQVFRWIDEAK